MNQNQTSCFCSTLRYDTWLCASFEMIADTASARPSGPRPSDRLMHTIKYHLILVSRILLSALSPQISSSVPTVRPNLVQVTPSLRLSDIRYYLVSITLSTKKPSRGGLVLVWRDSKSLRSQDKPACWMANHSGFVATRIEFCFSVLCFIISI